jgi:hypothetical protein
MTAWDFSPEQREIIEAMIEAALERRLGQVPYDQAVDAAIRDGGISGLSSGITLEPASITIDAGKPSPAKHFGTGLTFPIEGPD